MKLSSKSFTMAALAALLLVGAGCSTEYRVEKTLGQSANEPAAVQELLSFVNPAVGSTFDVQVGEPFTLTLDANITTGYSWMAEFNEAELSLVSQDYAPMPNEEKLVGRGGSAVFVFKLQKPGTAKLKMIYARPWEKDLSSATVKEYVISGK